jgi:hypothetical protein
MSMLCQVKTIDINFLAYIYNITLDFWDNKRYNLSYKSNDKDMVNRKDISEKRS